jgi:hypothetical protein
VNTKTRARTIDGLRAKARIANKSDDYTIAWAVVRDAMHV